MKKLLLLTLLYATAAFPNPSRGMVTFTSVAEKLDTITLFDVTGKALLKFENLSGVTTQVDISALSQGLYLATINGTTSIQLLKK